jgi:hypothetical protein
MNAIIGMSHLLRRSRRADGAADRPAADKIEDRRQQHLLAIINDDSRPVEDRGRQIRSWTSTDFDPFC